MNKSELLSKFKKLQEKGYALLVSKNNDYTGSDDALDNFKFVEKIGLMPAEKGIFVRMLDKISRTSNLLSASKVNVKDEKIEDTLIDLANYSLLLCICIEERKSTSQLTKKRGKTK